MMAGRFLFAISIVAFQISGHLAAGSVCAEVPADVNAVFPYPGDCSFYWQCHGTNATLQECPGGLWFNEVISSCDWPEQSGCINTTPEPTTTDAPTTDITTEAETTTIITTDQPSTSDPRCASGITEYFPHPTDCTLYIECYKGVLYEMSCPGGFWFDTISKRCLLPAEAECYAMTTTTEVPTTTTIEPICGDVPEGFTVMRPYEGNCSLYWHCSGTNKTLQSCSGILFFDAERQMCDLPSLSGCMNPTTTPEPTTTTDINSLCADGTISYWPHPTDCSKYYQCYNFVAYEMDCPAGLHYNEVSKTCEDPSLAGCQPVTFWQWLYNKL